MAQALLCCIAIGAVLYCRRQRNVGVTLRDMHGARGPGSGAGDVTLITNVLYQSAGIAEVKRTANVLYQSADVVEVRRTPNVLYQGGEAPPAAYAVSPVRVPFLGPWSRGAVVDAQPCVASGGLE